MSKRMSSKEAEQCKELVSFLTKRRDELKKAAVPKQITGLQLVWLTRHYYRIQDTDTVQYELSALMGLEYSGDRNMGRWKDHWDKMLRHCKTKLGEKDKEGIFIAKFRDKSDRMKPHLEYYDRLPETHADRCYQFMSDVMDRLIEDERKRRNTDSLVLDASGKEQRPPKQVAPAATHGSGGGGGGGGGGGSGGPGRGKGDGKGGKKGDKGGKNGGGRGNGKGPDGKPTKSPPQSPRSDSGSDSEGGKGKRTRDFEGLNIKDLEPDQKCCAYWFWHDANTGKSRCKNHREGRECPAPHLDKATNGIKKTKVWKKCQASYGHPNGPPPSAKPAAANKG